MADDTTPVNLEEAKTLLELYVAASPQAPVRSTPPLPAPF